jgi:hypothetical protein
MKFADFRLDVASDGQRVMLRARIPENARRVDVERFMADVADAFAVVEHQPTAQTHRALFGTAFHEKCANVTEVLISRAFEDSSYPSRLRAALKNVDGSGSSIH